MDHGIHDAAPLDDVADAHGHENENDSRGDPGHTPQKGLRHLPAAQAAPKTGAHACNQVEQRNPRHREVGETRDQVCGGDYRQNPPETA